MAALSRELFNQNYLFAQTKIKINNLKNVCNTKIEMLLNFDIFTQAIRKKSSCTDIYKKMKMIWIQSADSIDNT